MPMATALSLGQTESTAPAPARRARRSDPPRRILAVDDDRMALMLLVEELTGLGYEVRAATDGSEALAALSASPEGIDVVVLDKVMPRMDGIAVVRQLKGDPELRHIPVVMLTGDDDPKEVREGIDVGVFHYLTKPADPALMKSVLSSALREAAQGRLLRSELLSQRQGFGLIETCKFRFRTLEEAWDLASFLAVCFPDPERVLSGLAELLVNAVEHGNLEIGFDGKSQLIKDGTWREEVERRLALPEYKARTIEVVFTRKDKGVCVIITDQGKGFNWREYLSIDPARGSDSHGRGIAQAVTRSFDKLVFNAAGNQVVGYVSLESDIDW